MGDLELNESVKAEESKSGADDHREDKVFSAVEILIEEVAIGGIRRVYS